ncbi:hypothetical protein ABG810_00945 [Streptococcus iniae]
MTDGSAKLAQGGNKLKDGIASTFCWNKYSS